MRNYPNIWSLKSLLDYCNRSEVSAIIDGQWVPARPLGFASLRTRFRCAWLVFTGRADAVKWPGQ